jgi:hypothetical protein
MLRINKWFSFSLNNAQISLIKIKFSSSTNKNENNTINKTKPNYKSPEPNYQKLNPNSFKTFEYKKEFQTVTNNEILAKVDIVGNLLY